VGTEFETWVPVRVTLPQPTGTFASVEIVRYHTRVSIAEADFPQALVLGPPDNLTYLRGDGRLWLPLPGPGGRAIDPEALRGLLLSVQATKWVKNPFMRGFARPPVCYPALPDTGREDRFTDIEELEGVRAAAEAARDLRIVRGVVYAAAPMPFAVLWIKDPGPREIDLRVSYDDEVPLGSRGQAFSIDRFDDLMRTAQRLDPSLSVLQALSRRAPRLVDGGGFGHPPISLPEAGFLRHLEPLGRPVGEALIELGHARRRGQDAFFVALAALRNQLASRRRGAWRYAVAHMTDAVFDLAEARYALECERLEEEGLPPCPAADDRVPDGPRIPQPVEDRSGTVADPLGVPSGEPVLMEAPDPEPGLHDLIASILDRMAERGREAERLHRAGLAVEALLAYSELSHLQGILGDNVAARIRSLSRHLDASAPEDAA